MLLHAFLPDCCEPCCDCEKPDPSRDRVLINMPQKPTTVADPVLFPGEPPSKPIAAAEDPVHPGRDLSLEMIDEKKRKDLEEFVLVQQAALVERQAEEARELEIVREIAAALEAQEVAEAQELLEAQEASLREQERERETQDARRCEEEKIIKERQKKEEREDQIKVDSFLKRHGFSDIDSKRKTMFKSFYPLHSAVSQNSAEMVQLLLAAGARPMLKNSSELTALELARKLDKNGSHGKAIKLLDFGAGLRDVDEAQH